jgi:hypothetical protein
MDTTTEFILRKRMHSLYLTRGCGDILRLSRELLGLHCWFHRNVVFSALIRGAGAFGWKNALTKTWLYRGTLHGAVFEDLPLLLALHPGESYIERYLGAELTQKISAEIISLLEDGVSSRAEMRRIFAEVYDERTIEIALSPWGGVFVHLARQGKVAFKNMTSRDFELISAEPTRTSEEILPEILRRFFAAYGPATIADAAWFLGFLNDDKKQLQALNFDEFSRLEYNKRTYFHLDDNAETGDIPELTLLSGFDPLIVSYAERSAVLPSEYKSSVILKSGICNPTIAVNGQVAGLWNIKKNEPSVTFFAPQPKRIQNAALDKVADICRQAAGLL